MDPEVKLVRQKRNESEPHFCEVSLGVRAPGSPPDSVEIVIQPPWDFGVSRHSVLVAGDDEPWRLATFEVNLEMPVMAWIRDTRSGTILGRYRVEGCPGSDGRLTAQLVEERRGERHEAV